jgi:hypothetical protein
MSHPRRPRRGQPFLSHAANRGRSLLFSRRPDSKASSRPAIMNQPPAEIPSNGHLPSEFCQNPPRFVPTRLPAALLSRPIFRAVSARGMGVHRRRCAPTTRRLQFIVAANCPLTRLDSSGARRAKSTSRRPRPSHVFDRESALVQTQICPAGPRNQTCRPAAARYFARVASTAHRGRRMRSLARPGFP